MALESFLTNALTPAQSLEVGDFLDSQDTGHPFQFPQWAGPSARLFVLRESGQIRWAGTFSMHSPLGWKVPWIRAAAANRGPVCDDLKLWALAAEELVEYLRRERLTYFDLSPDWIQSPCDSAFLSTSEWQRFDRERASLRLDLKPDTDKLFANFSKNTRYEVRRAERTGATVTPAANEAEINEFLRLYQALAIRKGFQPDTLEHVRRAIHWLIDGPSRGALLLARIDGAIRGGAVIARAGRRCWYIWGASEKQPQVNVGHIVQWNALQWAKSHGCTEYDFGGYTPGATSGPAWFKAGFGGSVVRFVAPCRRVLRPGNFRVFSFLSTLR
jgi:peptidoglycan pentaglycine glycine transferase (the first glycine)